MKKYWSLLLPHSWMVALLVSIAFALSGLGLEVISKAHAEEPTKRFTNRGNDLAFDTGKLLGTHQQEEYPFSWNMDCDFNGCTTQEGKRFSFLQLISIFPTRYDAITRQDYFCRGGLCFDDRISPVGIDSLYEPGTDALIGRRLVVKKLVNGRPAVNVGDCSGNTCYVDKDRDRPVNLHFLMNQVPTLWKDANLYDCKTGLCIDKATGWVVGVDPSRREKL